MLVHHVTDSRSPQYSLCGRRVPYPVTGGRPCGTCLRVQQTREDAMARRQLEDERLERKAQERKAQEQATDADTQARAMALLDRVCARLSPAPPWVRGIAVERDASGFYVSVRVTPDVVSERTRIVVVVEAAEAEAT